VKEINYKGEGL